MMTGEIISADGRFYRLTQLPSGMRVITEHLPGVRSAALGVWVGYGSRDEDSAMAGAAHFLEHMLFKGTGSMSAVQIAEKFESLGAEFNAFTSREATAYHARFMDQHMPTVFGLLSDMVTDSRIDAGDFDSERQVIIEEIRQHNDMPDDRVHDLFDETAWGTHVLGRPIAGSKESIGGMARDDLLGLYKGIYTPDRMVLAAAGNIDHDQLVSMVAEAYPGRDGDSYQREVVEPSLHPGVSVETRDTEQVHLIIGGQGLRLHHPDRYDMMVLDCLLGGGMSSRLFQEIREKNGLAYSVYSHYAAYTGGGLYSVYVGTRPEKAKEAAQRVKAELIKLGEGGATEEEVRRCKEHIKGSVVLSSESTAGHMFKLGRSLISGGEILNADDVVARIESVTLEGVNDLARRLYDPERMVMSVVGPDHGLEGIEGALKS